MDKAEKRLYYPLGSALGARDSCNRVSWLSTHLLDFPAHEVPLQESAQVRSIFHSLPRAQVGTIDSEYHPQHSPCSRRGHRSHRTRRTGRCELYSTRAIRQRASVGKPRLQRYFPWPSTG